MSITDKVPKINKVIKQFFDQNPSVDKIPAKDLMAEFIKAGVFIKDHRNGLPIRKVLRALDEENELDRIPFVIPERKTKNTFWYFARK